MKLEKKLRKKRSMETLNAKTDQNQLEQSAFKLDPKK